jgi:hypothetical protein
MKPEYAYVRERTGIKPPTQSEYQEAARRGKPLSGTLLSELRAEARSKLRANVPAPTKASAASQNESDLVKKLKRRYLKLANENAGLKLKVILRS